MQDSLIPLFPLEVVLFPGQPLPLHIFEERYKVMIRECLAAKEQREFGVVLAKPNGIAQVGCTAEVVELVRSYADGRMDIVSAGRRRFEVLFVDQSKSYKSETSKSECPNWKTPRQAGSGAIRGAEHLCPRL